MTDEHHVLVGRRRRAELLHAYRNAANADEAAHFRADLERLADEERAARAPPRISPNVRTRVAGRVGFDRKALAAGERD